MMKEYKNFAVKDIKLVYIILNYFFFFESIDTYFHIVD